MIFFFQESVMTADSLSRNNFFGKKSNWAMERENHIKLLSYIDEHLIFSDHT